MEGQTRHLQVLDAKTLQEFLINAIGVWQATHRDVSPMTEAQLQMSVYLE